MSVEIKPQKSGYNHKTSLCLVYVSGKPSNVGDKYPLLYHLTIKNGIISKPRDNNINQRKPLETFQTTNSNVYHCVFRNRFGNTSYLSLENKFTSQ